MVIGELSVPDPDLVTQFCDIPPDTLRALKIIEPALYGGPLKTVGRAAYLLRHMDEASYNLGARPAAEVPPSGVAIIHASTHELWVQSLAVAPEYRGAGVGSALMEHVEQLGQQQQLDRVRLRVIGESAIDFYERLGYYPERNNSENSIVIDLYKPLA